MSLFPRFPAVALALLLWPLALTAQQAERDLPPVTVVRPQPADLVARIPISGTMVAREQVLVYPQVSGFPIREILADLGDTVAAGDVLARLADETLAAQLAQARAEKRRAEAQVRQSRSQIAAAEAAQKQAQGELDRQRQLRSSGAVSAVALEQAEVAAERVAADLASARNSLAVSEAQVEQAEAQLRVAQLNLDFATIIAPVAGVITERSASIGGIAGTAADPMFRIARDGDVEMEALVLETDLGGIEKGQPAQIEVAGGGTVTGEVRLVSPHVDPQTRLGTVRISVAGRGLRTGVFASGSITTDRRTGLVVPASAVLSDADGNYVLVARDGVLERVEVQPGLLEDERREIVTGLGPDDLVVARAGAFYRAGDRVQPVEEPAASAEAGQ